MRQEEQRLRRQLLQRVKTQVASYLPEYGTEVTEYFSQYEREFRGAWSVGEWAELQKSVAEASVVLGGDFHTFSQAQRTHLRVLRSVPRTRPVILALECVESRYNDKIHRFISGEISEAEFLSEVKWESHWGFSWAHYRPLFQLAQKRGYRVVGLNRYYRSEGVEYLEKRDRHAAKRILELQREWDENGSLVYVIYGEAHLSRPHLPKVLKSLSSTELTVVTIFQNSEKLYFDLAKQGDDSSVEVMKGPQNRFCIMSSPPWLKWQSYLVFLEKNFDVDLDEDEDAEGDFDFTDHFEHILSFILKDLGLNLEARDFVVYTPEQDYFKMIVERHCSGEEKKIAEFLMRNDRSFYLPQSKTFYLSRLTVNHSAGLAGHYIQSQLSGRARSLWDMPKDFLALIWLEALGFFTSKLINPKRKTEQLLDLKAQLATMTPGDQGRESLLLALDQRVLEIARSERKGASRRVKVKKATSYLIAARILGHMLGDRIFRLIREKKMHRDDVLVCFQKSVLAPDFENFYLEQVHKIDQWMKELSTKELL